MKIQTSGRKKGSILSRNSDEYYKTVSQRGECTAIDDNNIIADYFERTALIYTIDEAEDLVKTIKKIYPDYICDPYYGQGIPVYPIYQPPNRLPELDHVKLKTGLTLYRYKQAGEWVYGITNKWTDEDRPNYQRAVEAPMDGWEKWLADRKQMLKDKADVGYQGKTQLKDISSLLYKKQDMEKSEAQELIKKYSKSFGGNLEDIRIIELTGISHRSFYRYKKELLNERNNNDVD